MMFSFSRGLRDHSGSRADNTGQLAVKWGGPYGQSVTPEAGAG
tara:strand:- start:171 stop:299 length:129 start_codon:yes stop_codon:yes gene_type:complete